MASKAKKASAAYIAAKESPAIQRLIQDEDLRDDIRQAYDSTRAAYERLSNGKTPAKAIFDDKKLQKEMRLAAESIRDASAALREGPKKKRKGGFGRFLLLTLVAAGLALALSEDLRKKVLDALFGAEEEFEYTSATTASTNSGSTASTASSTTSTTTP